MAMVDQKTIQTLEFDKILERLSGFAVSSAAKRDIFAILPALSAAEAQRLLDTTEEMYLVYNKYNLAPVVPFDDADEAVKKSVAGASLTPGELLKVARLVRSARIAKKELGAAGEEIRYLKESVSALFINLELEKAIADSIAGEYEVKDGASDALRALRRKIAAADSRLKEKLASYTRSGNLSKYLQDSIVTIRNGRFVLPVKSECRSEIQGLIHDQSSSGATVFIEPLPVVELNNELKALQLEETREIERILKALSDLTAAHAENLIKCQKICIMLDIAYAKMQFSGDYRGTKPLLNESGRVNLKRARHPLIDKQTVIPVDLSFGEQFKLLLITGPNTGGKTVCLKTAGLFCMMACAGLFLPCGEESEVSVFDRIFCDIGDDQSILNSLSTFSSHILNITRITREVTNRSLVLLDELGGGTDPTEGAALALGIIRHLEKAGASGIITTHYGELKQYAVTSDRIQNGCMQFDEATLKPTYRLLIGIPGASHALKIAESLGLNPSILTVAKQNIGGETARFEEVLAHAERAKAEAILETEKAAALRVRAEDELALVEKERLALKDKTEKLNATAKLEVKRVVGSALDRANELVDQINALVKEADERSLLEAKRLRNRLEELKYAEGIAESKREYRPIALNELKIGMTVYPDGLDSAAVIAELPDKRGEATLNAGNVRFKISAKRLFTALDNPQSVFGAANPTKKPPKPPKGGAGAQTTEPPPAVVELFMLGLTVSEAIEAIEPYLMSHIGRNITLKIVHGKGTGALGKGVQAFLLSRKDAVQSVRYGGYGEGDRGVTFAELK